MRNIQMERYISRSLSLSLFPCKEMQDSMSQPHHKVLSHGLPVHSAFLIFACFRWASPLGLTFSHRKYSLPWGRGWRICPAHRFSRLPFHPVVFNFYSWGTGWCCDWSHLTKASKVDQKWKAADHKNGEMVLKSPSFLAINLKIFKLRERVFVYPWK